MSYEKQNFQNGQRLTAECLNRIEDGIVGLEGSVNKIAGSGGAMLGNKVIQPRSIEFVTRYANLFDKTDSKIQTGIYIKYGAYVTQSGKSYAVTHPIFMDAGVQYRWKHNTSIGGIACAALIDYCNLSIVEGYNTKLVEENGVKYENFTPPVSGYYAVNFKAVTADLATFMVCRADEYPDIYVSFGYEIHAPVPVEYVLGLNDVVQSSATNPLYGKSIALNGDSICASNGGYGKIIADRNAMTYENKAVGGATITAEQYTDSGVARHWISRTIANMDASADYAIVEGGVNDASGGVSAPMGEISDGYNATLDDTTFCGAFESMLKQLLTRFAGKKVGYIAVHKMTSKFRADKPDDGTSYYWAAKKCCEKWGVPFLDLNNTVPPFAYFTEDGNPDLYTLRTTYTQSGDGWHPTEEGFKKYYCDKIEAWMKAL